VENQRLGFHKWPIIKPDTDFCTGISHGVAEGKFTRVPWADAHESDIDEKQAWGKLLADLIRQIASGMNKSHD